MDKTFEFKLDDIVVSNFLVVSPKEPVKNEEIAFEFACEFKFDTENDIVNPILHFKLFVPASEKEGKNIILMHTDIHYFFTVFNLNNLITEDEERGYGIDTAVYTTLLSISFSTSRGIVYERTRSYGTNKLFLPIIKPSELIKDITFTKKD